MRNALTLSFGTLRNTKAKNGVPLVKLIKRRLYYIVNRYTYIQEHRNTGTHMYQDRVNDQENTNHVFQKNSKIKKFYFLFSVFRCSCVPLLILNDLIVLFLCSKWCS